MGGLEPNILLDALEDIPDWKIPLTHARTDFLASYQCE
jgi:hypothetical protein